VRRSMVTTATTATGHASEWTSEAANANPFTATKIPRCAGRSRYARRRGAPERVQVGYGQTGAVPLLHIAAQLHPRSPGAAALASS